MTVELALLISIISVTFGIYSGIVNIKRNYKKDTEEDTKQRAIIIVQLESIEKGVVELRQDIRTMNSDFNEMQERVVKVEESAKQAHKRIDNWEPFWERVKINVP